jgi:hypothetical protein
MKSVNWDKHPNFQPNLMTEDVSISEVSDEHVTGDCPEETLRQQVQNLFVFNALPATVNTACFSVLNKDSERNKKHLPWKNKFISGTANKLFKGNKHFSTS